MKKVFVFSFILLATGSFTYNFSQDEEYRNLTNNSFRAGETVEYRLHYGFITAGEGIVETSPEIFSVNNRPCYRVTVNGRTTGTFDALYKVRDTWRSYVDTSALITQRFYWNVREGKYKKEETVFFDQINKKIRSEEKNEATREFDKIPANLQDLISGYYYLRTLDFNKYKDGDMIPVVGFFDDKYYDFKIKFRGKEVVKTKFGKLRCFKLNPVMPKNDLFKGDNSIRFYVSDDENKIPVKVEADMFIGAIEVELKKYQNIKHPLQFFK